MHAFFGTKNRYQMEMVRLENLVLGQQLAFG